MTWRAIFLCSLLWIGEAAPETDTLLPNRLAEAPTPAGQCRFATAPRAIDALARPDAAAPSNTESSS
ncbi:hypothetical protein GCM10009087_53040 [Sphingomonas oligophenolica]